MQPENLLVLDDVFINGSSVEYGKQEQILY